MINLIERSKKYFLDSKWYREDVSKNTINDIVWYIKKEKIIVISWIKGVWKTSVISYIISNSNLKDYFLYLNKSLDLNNILEDKNSLKDILELYKSKYNNPKMIILENLDWVKNIKEYIKYLYNNSYITIIISNSIKIWNKKEFEIFSDKKREFDIVYNNKNKYLEDLKTKNTIFEEIIKIYNVKNIYLYIYTLTYLSNLNRNVSLRELNKEINNSIKVSLITMIDYLKYSINAKILKPVYVFDFKKKKEINTRVKYYFSSSDFRNSLYNFSLDLSLIKENFLFNELEKSWYKINSWINGVYEFLFYGNKTVKKWNNDLESVTIFIDICKSKDIWNIKKSINRLIKVPEIITKEENKDLNVKSSFYKYIVLDNKSEFWSKIWNSKNIKIVSFDELLKII